MQVGCLAPATLARATILLVSLAHKTYEGPNLIAVAR